jgi:hypothetical protein
VTSLEVAERPSNVELERTPPVLILSNRGLL